MRAHHLLSLYQAIIDRMKIVFILCIVCVCCSNAMAQPIPDSVWTAYKNASTSKMKTAVLFGYIFSGNAKPDQPYGLDSRTADFIKSGYAVGQSGVFGSREAQE